MLSAVKQLEAGEAGAENQYQRTVKFEGNESAQRTIRSVFQSVERKWRGIERFPAQAKQREEMAAYMDESLSEIKGIRLLKRDPRHTTRSFYRYIFAIKPQEFGMDHDLLYGALDAEGIDCWMGYAAMNNYTLFQPQKSKLAVPNAFPEYFDFKNMKLPEAQSASEHEAVWMDEAIFRAGPKGVNDTVAAIKKIQKNAKALNDAADELRKKYGR
jgi:hydrogenase/urease nickel incorporation metallochaperone HypA/DegT/DnrJ/EryC1/StrS aminotransferase family protein